MSHRARRPQRSTSLRAAVFATAVAGGVLAAPSATAFASDTPPKPKPTVSKPAPEDVAKKRAAAEDAKQKAPGALPRGGVAAGDKPVVREEAPKTTPKPVSDEARKRAGQPPRGGVAAGERPESGSDSTATLIGSAAGLTLLAGAGTMVLRRRTTVRRQG